MKADTNWTTPRSKRRKPAAGLAVVTDVNALARNSAVEKPPTIVAAARGYLQAFEASKGSRTKAKKGK